MDEDCAEELDQDPMIIRTCGASYKGLRCLKSPHKVGYHVSMDGDQAVWWGVAPGRLESSPLISERTSPLVTEQGSEPVVYRPNPRRPTSKSGGMCNTCGGMNLRPSGTCFTCQDCGTSTGCS